VDLLADGDARAAAGASAARHARERFSLAAAADAHELLYEEARTARATTLR
jgi:hypothetical protein